MKNIDEKEPRTCKGLLRLLCDARELQKHVSVPVVTLEPLIEIVSGVCEHEAKVKRRRSGRRNCDTVRNGDDAWRKWMKTASSDADKHRNPDYEKWLFGAAK